MLLYLPSHCHLCAVWTLSFIFLCLVKGEKPHGLRIYGGEETDPRKVPYVVKIGLVKKLKPLSYRLHCSGSVIAKTWTLTAAHCLNRINKVLLLAENETLKDYRPVIRYFVETWSICHILQAVSHPMYAGRRGVKRNDIGLLRTEEAKVSSLGKISSVLYSTFYGHKVLVAGYGTTNPIKNISDYWNQPSVQTMEAVVTKCDVILVAGGLCLASSCSGLSVLCGGDSGGPVIHHSGIVAINTASLFASCQYVRMGHTAGMVTPLSSYIEWISNHVKT